MDEQNENAPKQNYRWPWLVGAAIVLGIALAIVWVSLAVKQVERERDGNAPLPSSTPLR